MMNRDQANKVAKDLVIPEDYWEVEVEGQLYIVPLSCLSNVECATIPQQVAVDLAREGKGTFVETPLAFIETKKLRDLR